jgi:hypothetical protein
MTVEPGPLADIDAIMKATTPTLEGVTHARFLDEDGPDDGPIALCNKDDFPLVVMSFAAYKWFRENPGKISPEGA